MKELAGAIQGEVVLPDSPGYETARLAWNSRYDDVRPAAVVQVADAEDVREVVDFAGESELRLIPRSGAHSFAGYSTGDGVIVDFSRMMGVEVDAGWKRARIEAGATVLSIYRDLWPGKMAISGGICPSVGITGLTTGGGLGVLSRRHGLTCDNLIEVEIVTADGELLRANESENADLFWAVRGAGGGNFGVITALTFELIPVEDPFTLATFQFPWSAAEDVCAAWQEWLPGSPRETHSVVLTHAPKADEPAVVILVTNAGSEEETDAVVADLLAAIGTAPTERTSETGPFVHVEQDLLCKGLMPDECRIAEKTAAGVQPRPAFSAKSDIAKATWPREAIGTVLESMESRLRDPILTPNDSDPDFNVGKVLMEPADGAVNDVPSDATAFVHRDNLFVTQIDARWHPHSPQEVVDANVEWADGLYAALEPHRSGFAYQNYIDRDLPDWEHAYYGSNLPRLREVKAKYDPENFFRFERSIPPA